jgi:DNA-binding winged helix-turn-helix (wHTH) protein/tetratricopeptide (TPR) repeat protein
MGGIAAFRLGEWRVEPAANLLTRGEDEIRVELKVMEVLLVLAEHAGEVVSKRDLTDTVWQTEFIAENTLTSAIAGLRQALGDDARNPTYIQTIPKRGYRLLAEVERERSRPTVAGSSIEAASPPAFLADEATEEPDRPVFVARETELARLDHVLDRALAGHGSVAFVTGEAGSGKTALVEEFCRRAQKRNEDLVVASGASNAATGAGDPYGPWRQVLAQLSGDVESRVARGVLSVEAGRRLWDRTPVFAEAVVVSGRDLVETLISGAGLAARAAAVTESAPWLGDLTILVKRKAAEPPDAGLQQGAVFLQVGRVLRTVAATAPVLMILDDLHWADSATLALLCDLGRQLDGSRLLIVGTYRPEDVSVGRGGETHPLTPVIAELQRMHGEVEVSVGSTKKRAFVDSLVDTEINRLGEDFKTELFTHTHGHALFTVELLRTLQDREMLVRDDQGRWVTTQRLEWTNLPARVEGVVGARIDRLADELKDLLTIACVEGVDFTAEVLARVSDAETRDTIRLLSRELEKRHRLVSARGIKALVEGRLSLYGFSHVLFQHYLYNSLDAVERAQLHEDVGTVLEALYGEHVAEIAVQLALHFSEAGIYEKAITYLHLAGKTCIHRTANREAVGHIRKALELLFKLPQSPERDARELELRMAVQSPLIAVSGWADPAIGDEVGKVHALVEKIGDHRRLVPVLYQSGGFEGCARSLPRAIAIGERMLALAEEHDDETESLLAHQLLGWTTAFGGDLARGRAHLEEAVSRYDPARHHVLAMLLGADPAVACLSHLMWVTARMGDLDQAQQRLVEALELAERLDHPHSLAFARHVAFVVHIYRHEYREAGKRVADFGSTIEAHGFDHYQGWRLGNMGIVALGNGNHEEGIKLIERGIEIMEMIGVKVNMTFYLTYLAKAHHEVGANRQALAVLDKTTDLMHSFGEYYPQPELHLRRAEILLDIEGETAAEACLLEAIKAARGQRARTVELEAATALARLWQSQAKPTEARDLLQPVYEWFTEGLESKPLVEARELFDELSG